MAEKLTYQDVSGYPGIDLQGGSTGSKCVIGGKVGLEDKGFGLDRRGGINRRAMEKDVKFPKRKMEGPIQALVGALAKLLRH